MTWTTQQIAQITGGTLTGNPNANIDSMQTVERATSNQLTFIGHNKYAKLWPQSKAAAALVNQNIPLEPDNNRAIIHVPDVDLATATLLELMAPPPPQTNIGIHPTATVHPEASIHPTASIGPNCYVGPNATIGQQTTLHPNVTVMDHASIGEHTTIWPGTVIRENCSVGNHCIIHINVSIGADGFGYRPAPDGSGIVKIPQIGNVQIGHGVELGAGTCIDRAKFGTTTIGDGCKLDNMVQISHNCVLGKCVIIAGCSNIAGSTIIGDGVTIGGAATISDHLNIGNGATIAGGAVLMKDVPPGEIWAGYGAKPAKMFARELAALSRLPELIREYKRLK